MSHTTEQIKMVVVRRINPIIEEFLICDADFLFTRFSIGCGGGIDDGSIVLGC